VAQDDGTILRLKDVADIELGSESYAYKGYTNGHPGVSTMVFQTAGSNATQVVNEIDALLAEIEAELPKGVAIAHLQSVNDFLYASINEVIKTLIEAILLVVLVVYVFLQDIRSTLIPTVSIIVSLVGTFFIMYLAGFSINVLTMLAVVLAVGLVVDDAIVVTENIYVKIEEGMSPKQAGIEGSREIFFAVISTTITLISVFLPIVFMEGMTGRLFKEFSIVIAGAVAISAFAALTFTPMLATKLLRKQEKKNWFYAATEPFFTGMNNFYERTLKAFLARRIWALPIVAVLMGSIVLLWNVIPSELAPLEDRSMITVSMRGPEGTTFEFIRDYTDRIAEIADSIAPERQSLMARSSSGSGFINLVLPDIKARRREERNQSARVRPAAVHLRRTPRRHAHTICHTSVQSRQPSKIPSAFHGKSKRQPRIPDGRRKP